MDLKESLALKLINSLCLTRSRLADVCHPATSPRLHPVDHHSFGSEGDQLHYHQPLQKCALRLPGPDHHLQGLQQALACHRHRAAAGQRSAMTAAVCPFRMYLYTYVCTVYYMMLFCCWYICRLKSRFLPSGGSGDYRQTGCCLCD